MIRYTTTVGGAAAMLTAIACLGVTLAVSAKGPYDNAIKARQAMFQTYSFNSGILGDMAKEKMPYDADIASEAAANLDAAANFGQSQFWPQGSDSETEGNAKNRALPKIWETYPDITEKADALKEATAAMMAVAGDGLEPLQGAMGDVGAACKGCHDNFRAERK